MSWLRRLKLKTKILIAFGLCALITLIVAALGQSGIAKLYGQLQNTVTNNLVSIQKTYAIMASTIATNRDFFNAVVLTAR